MLWNQNLDGFLNRSLEQKRFNAEMDDIERREPVFVEMTPIDLFAVIGSIQHACETTLLAKDKVWLNEMYRISKQLEETLNPPPLIKQRITDKWRELGCF